MKLTHPLPLSLIAGSLAVITSFVMHAGAQDRPAPALSAGLETAIFAGGCFWCVEADFDKLDGVVETISGYTGGATVNPTYKTHSRQGHLEAVKVTYDPAKVDYATLVSYFVRHIDPTDAGGQFCDRGNSYTSAIFVNSAAERAAVDAEFSEIEANNHLPAPIVTAVRDETPFYAAERYHQDYYLKNATRYRFYRNGCGRDRQIDAVWGAEAHS